MSEKFVNKKRGKGVWITVIFAVLLVPAVILFSEYLGNRHYYISGIAIIILAMVPFFAAFESRRPGAREIVAISVMCAIAVASRVAFIMLPSFKPMVGIIMITGMAFGPSAGFLTGAVSGFVSNFVFGQGPWTPWQMFAFGLAGFVAGLLAKKDRLKPVAKPPVWLEKKAENGSAAARRVVYICGRLPVALFGFLFIMLIVGPILDTCTLFTMASMVDNWTAAAVYAAGAPVNAVHGAATFLVMFFACNPMLEKLDRIKLKYGMMEERNEI